MSENVRLLIAFLCGILTFAYLFVFKFVKGDTKGNRLKIKAEAAGNVTVAKVFKNDYRRNLGEDGRYNSQIVSYEYNVNGKRYTKKLTFTDVSITVNYPDEVNIYYDSGNPRKAYADVELEGDRQKQHAFHISLVVPIFVIISVNVLLSFIFK